MTVEVACFSPTDMFLYGEVIETVMSGREFDDISFTSYRPHQGEFPETLEADAVVVTGSEFHVYDRQPWQGQLKMMLQHALASDVPVLGICYGHQLLADVLGGTVKPMKQREMGYREIEVVDRGEREVFDGVDRTFMSFTSHEDHVSVMPEDTTVLARNERCAQAFEAAVLPAVGVQFHPEYGLGMARELLASKDVSVEFRQEVEATLTEENFERSRVSRRVFDNFFETVV
jgi:GMP synthase (glutamine-hydrolysing)